MQTTLLGLAIAFILALIAALVGPYFVDWNQFRPQFEAEASRIVGAPVRVGGKLDALLLPTPTLRLRSVAIGGDNDPARVRAGKLDVEFSLGSLMRGEWRASELSLDGFMLDLGLDRQGRFEWPSTGGRFNLGSLAIDRMNVAGRIALHDASSGKTLLMDDLKFSGDVRALASSLRGDGSFTLLGARTPFRISSGQSSDGKGTRVRFVVEPGERPLLADLDGVLTFDSAVPIFEGGLTLARPADAKSTESGQPWRLTSRVKASPSSAAFEQVEAAYGPEDHALRLTGSGDIRFGASPLLHLVLSARQLDADRLLAKGATNAEPMRLFPAMRTLVTSLPVMPLPAQIEASADQIALGGRPLQNVAVELRGDEQAWTIVKLEMRAPGATRVSANGIVAQPGASARFTGPVSIESSDPAVLAAWLHGRSDATYRNQKPLRLRGDATVAADRVAFDGIKADVNGGTMEGRLALLNVADGKTRFEAVLKAPSFDLDAMSPLVGALVGPQSGWPDEGQVTLNAESAVLAGETVRPVAVSLSFGPTKFALDRIEIGNANSDLAVSGTGSFDRAEGGGKLGLYASASSLERVGSLVSPFAPALAERLAALPKEPGSAVMLVAATLGKAKDRSGRSDAEAVLNIEAPQLKGTITLKGSPSIDLARGLDLAALRGNPFNLETSLTANQTSTIVASLGLDRIISPGDGPAQFESSVAGVWGSPLQLKAKLTGAGVDGDIQGTGNPWADQSTAALTVAVRRADLAALFDLQRGSMPAPGVSLSSRLGVAGNTFTFDDLDTTVGGSRIRGRLVLTRGDEIGVDGEVGLDTLDVAAVTGVAFGAIGRDASAPLGRGWLRGWRGRLAFQALSGTLPGGGELRPISGAIKGDGQSLVLENVKAGMGGGEAVIDLDARQAAQGTGQGTSFNARVQVTGVDGPALRYRGLAVPDGKVALKMTLAGQGRSAAGLTGALSGAGTLTLTDARIAGLDPRAFEAAVRASDGGQATDDIRLKEIVEPMLVAGALKVPSAQIPFTIKDGRLRVEAATLDASRARVAIAGGYDLLADQADIRAVMSPVTTRLIQGRPEIRVDLNGSPDRLARTVDVAALSSWLGMRAIDRETRRLDQLERGVAPSLDPDGLWEEELPKAEPIPPSEVKIPNRDPRRKNSGAKAAVPRAPVASPAVTPPAVPPPVAQPAPASSGGPLVQPLPPPIDIKPAPGAMRLPKQRPAPSSPAGTF
ncbi:MULTISPECIES: AsmA-like C-terminal region-containing protein [unclassified Afipia]|uniref:AsmA family protein n=1 Tax=unclassified Afipia TaxID=2642050 RepID=UPI00042671E9|nr:MULTISPECIES: AsmA-like C-terminal region-containing protein [unclassified Afipia]